MDKPEALALCGGGFRRSEPCREPACPAHDFSLLFRSDFSTAEDVEWENVNPVEAMLGENGLVSKYGAELARDWYDVFLVRRVGNDTDVSIREKKEPDRHFV